MSYITDFCDGLEGYFKDQLGGRFDIQTSVVAIKSKDGFYGHAGYGLGYEEALANPSKNLDRIFSECLEKYPRPHIHSIKNYALPFQASKKVGGEPRYSAIFVPVDILERKGVYIGLVRQDFDVSNLEELAECAANLVRVVNHASLLTTVEHRLIVTEHFVKEIGHDIASYAQATLGKARLITRGQLSPEAIVRTSREIESEVLWACNVADYFGLAIESNYQLREKAKFFLCDAVKEAIGHFEAEANERRIALEFQVVNRAKVVGDKPAIRQAMAHLILNAVKYSTGGTSVKMSAAARHREVVFTIFNTGNPLPRDEEQLQIWEFGFRGKKAREMHVNGSGIGLYTVKKVIEGHGGRVWCEARGSNGSMFGVALPEA